MATTFETLAISEIERYSRNARMHSPEQVQQLVNSITEFGFTNPVLVDEVNSLIAGHGRLAAAEQIGLTKVPAIRVTGLTENQIKALRIADNQLALNATWDLDLLAAELNELHDEEFSLDLLGFDDDFIRGLLDDDTPEITDGHGEGDNLGADDEAADVVLVLGPYRQTIKRRQWDKWETTLRAKVGFDKDDIEKEISKRLGFDL